MYKDLAVIGLNIVLARRNKERLNAAAKEVKISNKNIQTKWVLKI